eukprot:2001077-Pyramimonas_sp.AAC.1
MAAVAGSRMGPRRPREAIRNPMHGGPKRPPIWGPPRGPRDPLPTGDHKRHSTYLNLESHSSSS